jgi:hypothetical protein
MGFVGYIIPYFETIFSTEAKSAEFDACYLISLIFDLEDGGL